MTKRIILNMLVIALASISYAQCDDCYEDNGISTNPNNQLFHICNVEASSPRFVIA